MGLFKKCVKKSSYNDGDDFANLTKQIVTEDLKKGGSVSKVAFVKSLDVKSFPELPTVKEYDLEEMLKAGAKPQQLNVRGSLGYDFDLQSAVNSLAKPFEQDDKSNVGVEQDDKSNGGVEKDDKSNGGVKTVNDVKN